MSGVKHVPLHRYVGHISSFFFFHFHGYGSMLLMGLLDGGMVTLSHLRTGQVYSYSAISSHPGVAVDARGI